ncbi:hypothetical protein HRbin17_01896 [bacterium HR17]|uniref:NodB homology domain-containing protein n=1 Tax=Candidatus Fervidibacter japonicus TaxID=2035412 RepID=A0A2H5XDX7_9BACT|nr:hypothetical protein HRbin17_01896 [bacterium HR17]
MAASVETPFPQGCVGAASLTFDDGLRSQYEIAVPLLNERNLRATFYLNPRGTTPESDDWRQRWAQWQNVAQQGHEIGNHSLTHPCSRALGDRVDVPCLERMTLADIEADVLEAERRLRLLTGVAERSFAYPCYQDFVGSGLTRQSYVPVIAKHFVAARGGGERPDNHPLTCDLHALWSLKAEYLRGAELIGWVEWTAQRGRWLIFTFHGVDEGHLPIARYALQELCDYLTKRRDIWVAPVVEVAKRIAAWRAALGVQ